VFRLFIMMRNSQRKFSTSRFEVGSFIAIMVLGLFLLLSGCSKEKVETIPHYDGWKTYSYKHFVFHFPEDCFWGTRMAEFSNAYERYLEDDCEFLAINVPSDTINFYIYDSPEQGKELTGHDIPYHTDNQIHWGRKTAFGLELARYLIDKMGIRRTDFNFLYDGLAALRDYSNANYHHNTIVRYKLGKLIPLDSLANNDSYARADTLWRVDESASFVAYLTYNYGINRFKMLWQSAASFDKSVDELFDTNVETLQKDWLDFAEQFYEGLPGEQPVEDSSKTK
jgi:hypothetical protein